MNKTVSRSIGTLAIIAGIVVCGAHANLPIGGQNGSSTYYSGDHRYFTDYAKYLGAWWFANQDGSPKITDQDKKALLAAEKAGALDSNGYPLEAPFSLPGFTSPLYVESVLPGFFEDGDYVLTYDGVGTIDFYKSSYITIKSTAANRIVLTCKPMTPNGMFAVVMIKTSQKGNHVRNIKILPAAIEKTYNPAQPFTKEWLDVVNHLSVYRFMGHCGMNDWVTHGKWKDRVTRNHYSQSTGRGISYELGIQMCNLLKVDPWFCIPHMVDDEYIRNFAQLVKETLDPARKVYIEYSNEIWNWAFAYPQAQYVINCGRLPGMPEWDAADTVYNTLKKMKDAKFGHPEMDAYMIQRTLNIWRSVFTGADRSRLICVAAAQIGWSDNTRRILNYLYNTNSEFTNYGSTGSGCDAVAGAPYFSRDESVAEWSVGPLAQTKYARERKILSIYYEGGSEGKMGTIGTPGVLWNMHQEMYTLYDSILQRMQQPDIACDMYCALTVVGDLDGYAHLDTLPQVYLPTAQQPLKWQAIMKYTSRVPVQYPYEVGVIPGSGASSAATRNQRTALPGKMVFLGAGTRLDQSGSRIMRIDGRSVRPGDMTSQSAKGIYLRVPPAKAGSIARDVAAVPVR